MSPHTQRPASVRCSAEPLRPARTPARASAALAALLALVAAAVPAAAQDVGQVVVAVGEVKGAAPGASPRPLAAGDGFSLGYEIATGASSEALLTFDPRGSLRLYDETRIRIDQALVDSAGRASSRLSVLVGRLRLAVGSLFRGELAIDTPTAVVGIKGTDLWLAVAADGTTLVAVFEGEVLVSGKAGGEVRVRAGYRTLVRPGSAPLPPVPIDREQASPDPLQEVPADLYDDFPAFPAEDQLPFPPERFSGQEGFLPGVQLDPAPEPPQ